MNIHSSVSVNIGSSSVHMSQSKYSEWQPSNAKGNIHETINSEESFQSLPSAQYQDDSLPNEDIHEGQPLDLQLNSHNNRAPAEQSTPHHHKKADPNQSGLDGTLIEIHQAIHSETTQKKLLVPTNQPQQFNPNNSYLTPVQYRSYDQVSGLSYVKPPANKHLKVYSFYYDRTGDLTSQIMPPESANDPAAHIIKETVVPLVVVFIVMLIIYFIQSSVQDYCYLKDDFMPCSTYDIRFWSFARQMIMFKLSMILYRRHLLAKVAMGTSNQAHKNPIMESLILGFLAVGIDFIFVMWIENNQDWVFLLIIYAITIAVMLSTFRMRDWIRAFYRGKAIFLYDIVYVAILCYLFYVIPTIIDKLREDVADIKTGNTDFMYLYPLLDLVAEIFLDWILAQVQSAELYVYQAQLMLIGLRVGVLLLNPWDTFSFWYLILVLIIMRANNSSLFLTVFIRRFCYYSFPKFLRPITGMEETPRTLKGKHGAYLEHQAWIIYFYLFYIGNYTIPYYAGSYTMIKNNKFENDNYENILNWYQPIIIWVGLLIGEILGVMFNKQKKHDNIKWLGGTGLTFIENCLVRLQGYYFFQIAFMVPFLTAQLSLLDRNNVVQKL